MNRITFVKSAAGLVPLLCATFCPAHAAPVAARPADELVNSIGVNVKLGYDDTPYGNHATVKAKLQELGIRHIRDGLAGTAADAKTQGIEATIRDLNAQGVKFLAVISTNTSTVAGKTEAQAINDAIGRLSGAVEAVEGPNEPDNFGFSYGGQNFPQSIVPFQTMLWNAVKNGPNSALPVLAPSLGNPNNSSLVIDSAHSIGQMLGFGESAPHQIERRREFAGQDDVVGRKLRQGVVIVGVHGSFSVEISGSGVAKSLCKSRK